MMLHLVFILSALLARPVDIPPAGNSHGVVKVLEITADPAGHYMMGKDTLSAADLSREIRNRLWKSYLGTGKMHDRIRLVLQGEVLMGVRGDVMDAIKKGQELALTEICLEKHKTRFEELSAKQQQKIKKQFPVLFQTDYS